MTTVVDLRSDTLALLGDPLRRVMAEAKVGDDVFQEDPTVQALQQQTAELLGMEAALFMPTGTMANLIAVMNHCWGRGGEIILGDRSHIFLFEQGGVAQLGGVHSHTIPNLPDGTFSLNDVRKAIRVDDLHLPVTKLVCIENTHNMMGGKVLPLDWIDEMGTLCRELNVPLHMDGARLLNAAVALQMPPSRLTRNCDSVAVCLSKGLGAPVGSLLVGNKEYIQRAVRLRKVLGGGMRQSGFLAAAGALALSRYQATLTVDHQHAKTIAKAVRDSGSTAVSVDYEGTDTNIVMLNCDTDKLSTSDLESKLREVNGPEDTVSVKGAVIDARQVRLVTHCNITSEAIASACRKIVSVITN